MSDFPKFVQINEEGPREGFQFEKGPIATERKVELIDALSETGLNHIQIASFSTERGASRTVHTVRMDLSASSMRFCSGVKSSTSRYLRAGYIIAFPLIFASQRTDFDGG